MTTLFGYDIGDVGSLFEDFGAKDIISGVSAFGQITGSNDAEKNAQKLAETKQANDFALLDKQQAQAIELLKLKAALGGGGGGGGGTDMRPYIYQGGLAAREQQMQGARDSSNATIGALRTLLEAAQRPLSR